jgi:hypothetical protein
MHLLSLRHRSARSISFVTSLSSTVVPILAETSYLTQLRSPQRKRHLVSEILTHTRPVVKKPIDFARKVRHIMTHFDSVKDKLDRFHRSNLSIQQAMGQAPSSLGSLEQSFEGQ